MSYRNVDGWQVILIDGRRDSELSWVDHRGRRPASLGGVDCVAQSPLPVHAPADGRIEFIFNNGSGGHTARLLQPDGWVDEFMHLSAPWGAGGRWVRQGELIAFTGSTGGVPPHLHWHRIDPTGWYRDAWATTNRRNPWHYFSTSATAGGSMTLIEEFLMALSDKEQREVLSMLRYIKSKTQALNDGVFIESPTSRGTPAGVLGTLRIILAKLGRADDALFLDEPTSFGSSGGALRSLADLQRDLAAVTEAMGEVVDTVASIARRLDDALSPVPVGPSFGIDVAWPQAAAENGGKPFPFAQAKVEGAQFVIVKASGFNVKPMYVADGYVEHVDGARAADLHVGHYYLVGKGDPVVQADWFVDHLHDYRAGDVLGLDNERLDANGAFWVQDDVVKWVTRVLERTGTSPDRVWVYFPASATRKGKPWDKVESLGIRRWWAAFGDGPTVWRPDHQPSVQGALSGWDVHQFTSKLALAGRTVDGNFSPLPISDLFG